MTPDQQARERLAREATPGPWDWRSTESLNAIPGPDGRHYGPRVLSATYEYDTGADIKVSEADMAHIAANSPSVILADLARLRALEEEVARLRVRMDEERREWYRHRDVDVPCARCGGAGSLTYGNTSTWRGGCGGNAMTRGVCDQCWGSGEEGRPWMSHREAEAAIAALHAQDTDDEPRAICHHNIVADECGICDDLSRAAEVGR